MKEEEKKMKFASFFLLRCILCDTCIYTVVDLILAITSNLISLLSTSARSNCFLCCTFTAAPPVFAAIVVSKSFIENSIFEISFVFFYRNSFLFIVSSFAVFSLFRDLLRISFTCTHT